MQTEKLIPIAAYAEKIGITANAVRRKCLRGTLPGAIKIGRDWLIPADAPYPDKRITSGKYVRSRANQNNPPQAIRRFR